MTSLFLLQQGGGLTATLISFLPFFAIFFIFYFLVILPQKRRQRAAQEMVANLKAGDKIITNGGIIATISTVRDNSLIVRTADKSMLEISRAAVAGLHGEMEKQP